MIKLKSAAWRADASEPLPLIELYQRMLLVRECEVRLAERFNDGKIPGFIHLSIGQEAVAVGVAAALRKTDTVASPTGAMATASQRE